MIKGSPRRNGLNAIAQESKATYMLHWNLSYIPMVFARELWLSKHRAGF